MKLLLTKIQKKIQKKISEKCNELLGLQYLKERRNVNSGKRKFIERSNSVGNHFHLRRNIHRIEKGLIMEPRRDVFAKEYLNATVTDFSSLCSNKDRLVGIDSDLVQWANDVLDEYFSVVKLDEPFIKAAKEIYDSVAIVNLQQIPKKRVIYENSDLSFESLHTLAYQRRSVRWYDEKLVPRDLVEQAMSVGLLAPSACNRQPFHFIYYDDPELVSKIGSYPSGTGGISHNFPAVMVVVGDLSAYEHLRDRHLIYIDASLAAMSFVLALETVGLSSCMINWPDIPVREKAMRETVPLEQYERVVMLISIGYAKKESLIPYSTKKSASDVIRYNLQKNKK